MVSSFDYLGLRLTPRMDWSMQVQKVRVLTTLHNKCIKMFRETHSKRAAPAVEVYNVKALGAVLYETEIWGHVNCSILTTAENRLVRSLLAL